MQRNVLMSIFSKAAALVCCATLFALGHAAAQGIDDFQQLAQQWVGGAVSTLQSDQSAPLRFEVRVGKLDSRLKLAPCGKVEPYLVPGARLWGKSRIGLQCADGAARWNVSLPVTISAFGKAWVIRDQVLAGSKLTESDVMEAEVDWASESAQILRDKSLWLGQMSTRTLHSGQPLRQGMVRPMQVFQAGTQVRVIAQGSGFEVSSDAQALSGGIVGQVARVRMENGRIASGVVLDAHTVKIEL
jgi:flagella basal body P-ring formation protein FlgA